MVNKYIGQSAFSFQAIVISAVAALIYAVYHGYTYEWWLLSLAVYFAYGCLGITVCFHRYLTHRSFTINKWKEYILVLLGHLAGTGSAVTWVAIHHDHHIYADTKKDPHSPVNGLWGMITLKYNVPKFTKSRVALALAKEPFYKFLHNYYLGIHLVYGVGIYLLFGFTGLLFGHLIPVAFTALVSALSNYFSHTFGYRNHDTWDGSRNDPIMALLAWGEGWHNNHHKRPNSPKFGEKWWEFDVSWYVIKLIRNG